jgi:hypothetical protein
LEASLEAFFSENLSLSFAFLPNHNPNQSLSKHAEVAESDDLVSNGNK